MQEGENMTQKEYGFLRDVVDFLRSEGAEIYACELERIIKKLKSMPKVVRCKDCRFHEECMEKVLYDPEWYCADGVKE